MDVGTHCQEEQGHRTGKYCSFLYYVRRNGCILTATDLEGRENDEE